MKRFWFMNKKHILTAMALGLAITVILQATVLAQQCHHIRDSVVRLHIVAHSDDSRDQLIKLKVRDALLSQGGHLLDGAKTKEEALQLTRGNLSQFTKIARKTIAESGQEYGVSCRVESCYFNTRTYDTVTLPAGRYTALRVVIGEGKGHNWWCVMFPPMCVPAAGQPETHRQPLQQVLNPGQTNLVENGTKYEIRFKTVELVQSAANKCRDWWESRP